MCEKGQAHLRPLGGALHCVEGALQHKVNG